MEGRRVTEVLLAISSTVLILIGTGAIEVGDPFDQSSFPCQEDEVLGYAPQFGPDRVGCIHIDNLKG
jgi:hypothetical protein